MANGTLVFDTKIDTSDIGKGLNKLRSTLNTSAKNIGEKMASGIKSGMNGIVTATQSSANTMENAFAASAKKISSVFSRLGRMIKRIFVFSLALKALSGLRKALSDSLNSSKEFSEAMGRLRSALSSAFQPLVQTILPYLIKFVNWLAKAVATIGELIRSFSNNSDAADKVSFSLSKEEDAISGVGAAAKKAEKDLAGFDEVNKLSNKEMKNSGGSGAGISKAFDVKPDLKWVKNLKDWLPEIKRLAKAIGFAFAGWKIGGAEGVGVALALDGILDELAKFKKHIEDYDWQALKENLINGAEVIVGALIAGGKKMGGKAAIFVGALTDVENIFSIIKNGTKWSNVTAKFVSDLELLGGALATFGTDTEGLKKVGVAMLIKGLADSITSLYDQLARKITWENITTGLLSAAESITGAFLAAGGGEKGKKAAGIVAAFDGGAKAIVAIREAIADGINFKNAFQGLEGLAENIAGVTIATGSLAKGLMGGALTVALAFFISDLERAIKTGASLKEILMVTIPNALLVLGTAILAFNLKNPFGWASLALGLLIKIIDKLNIFRTEAELLEKKRSAATLKAKQRRR